MSSSVPTSAVPAVLPQRFSSIRRAEYGGRTVFCLPDIVAFLQQTPHGQAQWSILKHQLGKQRVLADCFAGGVICLPFTGSEGQSILLDAAEPSLALRIAAHIDSPLVTRLFEHLMEVAAARRVVQVHPVEQPGPRQGVAFQGQPHQRHRIGKIAQMTPQPRQMISQRNDRILRAIRGHAGDHGSGSSV